MKPPYSEYILSSPWPFAVLTEVPLYIHCKKKVFNLHGEENQQITENII